MQTQNQTTTVNTTNFASIFESNAFSTTAAPATCASTFTTSAPKKKAAIKPSDKEVKKAAVEKFVNEGVELSKLHDRYNEEFVVRGNRALYELLASIYSYALRINESAQKEQIIERMIADLKDRQVKTTKNTHWLTTVVKFIVKTDRQTASNYSRVLQVAFDENLADSEMAGYIERRGGVAQIRETEAVAAAKVKSIDVTNERIDIMREFLKQMYYKSQHSFTFDGNFAMFPSKAGGDPSKETTASESAFCHFMAIQVKPGEYKIVSANDFGKGFEDVILRHMSTSLPEDMNKLRSGIQRMKDEQQKIADAESAAYKAKKLGKTKSLPA